MVLETNALPTELNAHKLKIFFILMILWIFYYKVDKGQGEGLTKARACIVAAKPVFARA